MRKILIIVSVLLITSKVHSQNLPACDSLVINCCIFNSGSQFIGLEVMNQSSVLFDYPGFVILDSNLDTIAKETVNYFGLGGSFQQHALYLYVPWTLPFQGYLNLYTLFYDSLVCSFPLNIPDTSVSISEPQPGIQGVHIYPNPSGVDQTVFLNVFNSGSENSVLSIKNLTGQTIQTSELSGKTPVKIELRSGLLTHGIFIVELRSGEKIIRKRLVRL